MAFLTFASNNFTKLLFLFTTLVEVMNSWISWHLLGFSWNVRLKYSVTILLWYYNKQFRKWKLHNLKNNKTQTKKVKNIKLGHLWQLVIFGPFYHSVPWSQRSFFIFPRAREPRIARRRTRVAKRRKRKTSGYLRLESDFHADARVRIWPSGSDWLIFLQTRKSTWLVRLIGNTEWTVGISVIALLQVNFDCLYQERKLFA